MKKYQKEDEISYSIGAFPTIELIHHQKEHIANILLSSKLEAGHEIFRILKSEDLPFEVNDRAIEKLSDKENVYVIGLFDKYVSKLSDEDHVVLVNPSNMGNIGTIMRTMLGFGLTNLAIIKPGADIFDPKVIRASMGAIFQMKIRYYDSFAEYRKEFPEHALYPFMLQSAHYLDETKFSSGHCSLVFGPEASGLDNEYLGIGEAVKIRQSALIDSFNLPISVSVACYEFARQKKLAEK